MTDKHSFDHTPLASRPVADMPGAPNAGPDDRASPALAGKSAGAPSRRKLRWIAIAAGFSVLSWLALGAGILLDAGTTAMFILASLAAVSTEGAIWLAALMLGVSAYQVRRRLWDGVRRGFS